MIIKRKNNKKKGSTVYILCGLPGSGKSTWCKKYYPKSPIVSRDIIRAELGFTSGPNEKARLENWQEEKVTEAEYKLIRKYLRLKIDFIIDDTNLRKLYRKPLIDLLYSGGAYIIGVNFITPLKICIERRKHQIPKEAMVKLKMNMEKITKDEVDELIWV